jgi:hypothetical protein
MAVQRWSWLAGVASVLVVAGVADAEEASAHRQGPPREAKRPPVLLGVMADAGVPDGANGALALRAPWLRVHLGGGYNTVSGGLRGGVTLLPLRWGPSASVELGRYREGDANGLVRTLVGSKAWLTPVFQRLGYTYVNTQLGFELGRGRYQFFVHAGASYVRAVIHNVQAAIENRQATSGDGVTTVRVTRDPVVHAWIPSLKLGMVVYLGGGA